MKVAMLIVGFMLLGSNVFSQEVHLERIVVTPYKVVVSEAINPSSTNIISVEELQKQGVFSLKNAIEDISSLSYAITGSWGGDTGVFIRGAGSNHTQVLLDGIRIYDPIVTSAYFYGYNYMSLDNIDKIEVLKGPFSTLYGSDSIGGTISLITNKGKGNPSSSYLQEFGSNQITREMFSSEGKIDDFAYSVSLSKTDVRKSYAGKYKNGNQETDPYHNFNSSMRLDYAFNDDVDVSLLTDYTYAKYDYDAWGGTDDKDNYAYFHQGIGGLNLNHRATDSFSHKTTLGYTRTHRKGWESSTSDYWYDGKTYQVKWQGDYRVCDINKLIVGIDYLREQGQGNWNPWSKSPKRTSNSKGYYAEYIYTPLSNLFLSTSFRVEDHSEFNTHNVFAMSGSYLIEETNTKLKASFGEGFKAPSIYQLYDTSYGNRNLNPEESESYEIGFEQKVGNALMLGSTYFHTHIKNLIEWTSTGWWTGEYSNVGKARIHGIENFIKYELNDKTSVNLSYTHMNAKNLTDGKRLPRRPDNKITCKVKREFDKLDVYTSVSYVGNRIDGSNKLKPYIMSNLALNYTVNEKWNMFLRLENVLDKDYELVKGYQTPKFSAYLGTKIRF